MHQPHGPHRVWHPQEYQYQIYQPQACLTKEQHRSPFCYAGNNQQVPLQLDPHLIYPKQVTAAPSPIQSAIIQPSPVITPQECIFQMPVSTTPSLADVQNYSGSQEAKSDTQSVHSDRTSSVGFS